jgi:hypothetical protein
MGRELQRCAGVYDAATEAQMKKPRCGLPDILATTGGRRKRYVLAGEFNDLDIFSVQLRAMISSFSNTFLSVNKIDEIGFQVGHAQKLVCIRPDGMYRSPPFPWNLEGSTQAL